MRKSQEKAWKSQECAGSPGFPGIPGKPRKAMTKFSTLSGLFLMCKKTPELLTRMISGTPWLFPDSGVSWKAKRWPASKLCYLGEWSKSRKNARASGEAPGGRGKASRSCVLARLSSLAQIGELARRLAKTKYFTLSGGIWLRFLALPCSSLIPRFPGKPRKAKRKWSMFSGLFLGQKSLEFELLTSMILSSLGSSLIPGFPGKPRKAKRNYSMLSRLLLFKKAWNPCSLKHDHLSWFWGFLESVVKPGKPRKNFPSFPGLCLHVQKSWNFWLRTISGCHGSSTFRKAWKAKEKFPCF